MGMYYLSKNYKEINSAGNKAKTDIEAILKQQGYKEAGLPQTNYRNNIIGFLVTLMSVLKVVFTISKNDTVILQYPFKKYYSFVCKLVHYKGGKVITFIHDLGSFRRKKLTIPEEIKRLAHSDILIVHNERMKEWLLEQNYQKPIVCLEIFDYLSSTQATTKPLNKDMFRVIYAGGLSYKKNRFLYLVDEVISRWHFVLYGNGFEQEQIKNPDAFTYKGFTPSDELITNAEGDFGLVWDGESITTCSGTFGEYLKYNNPHKASLYIRCQLPVIIWKQAALASFVSENKIGICIDSLEELKDILPAISKEEYLEMKENTKEISRRLSTGYYSTKALKTAEKLLFG